MREETPEEAAIKKLARQNYDYEAHREKRKERELILKATRGRWSIWDEHLDFQKRLEAAHGIEEDITKPWKPKKKKKVTK